MKRLPFTFGLLLLGMIAGLPVGSYVVQHKFIQKEKAVGMMNEEAIVDDYAKKEFMYGDSRNARNALTYAIKMHTEMQKTNALWWGRPQKSDLGWCYVELSVLEESAGNTSLAREYMSEAQQTLKEAGLKDPSESHIRAILQADSHNQPLKAQSR